MLINLLTLIAMLSIPAVLMHGLGLWAYFDHLLADWDGETPSERVRIRRAIVEHTGWWLLVVAVSLALWGAPWAALIPLGAGCLLVSFISTMKALDGRTVGA